MAQIGLKYLRYSLLDADGKYTGAKTLGRAIETKVNPTVAEGKLYADDTVAESVEEVTGGTVEITVDGLDPSTYAEIMGHEYSQQDNIIKRNRNAIAPFIGMGRVITLFRNNTRSYKVEFLNKVKFKDNLPEEKTKGENIEFGTPTFSGNFYVMDNGYWSETGFFDTVEEAQAYLDGLMATPQPSPQPLP